MNQGTNEHFGEILNSSDVSTAIVSNREYFCLFVLTPINNNTEGDTAVFVL
jgi:hypothetical protein